MKCEAERGGEGDVSNYPFQSFVVALSCSEDACGEEAVREREVRSDGDQLEDEARARSATWMEEAGGREGETKNV